MSMPEYLFKMDEYKDKYMSVHVLFALCPIS